jgi:hypothetical protein
MKLSVSRLIAVAALGMSATTAAWAEVPTLPKVSGRLLDTPKSHAFLASGHLRKPVDLGKHGYVEEEYLVTGSARIYDWPENGDPKVLSSGGPYTTRILVRRPKDAARFNGAAIVEPLNPSSGVDAPIMWAESYLQLMSDGFAWIGVTIKPNTIKTLKEFDPVRYARVAMPNPEPPARCNAGQINPLSLPTTPSDETGLAWDMLSQIGALLKSASADNPLRQPAQLLYMTGQSQTAGYARTYASVFGTKTQGPNGKPLYDAYLYSGSPPWQVPLHQCREDLEEGDPRLITPAVGVPVIELFAQGDLGTNLQTRRPDADGPTDLYRRYEIPGAPHVDPWEQLSFASSIDMGRIRSARGAIPEAGCEPADATPSDFPNRYVFNAAWRNLDRWVREGVPPPRASPVEIKPEVLAGAAFVPDQAFVVDAWGNAKGGVRTPYVDVPTARWVGAKSGQAFQCMFLGYKLPFDAAKLKEIHGDRTRYVERVRESAARLEKERWITPEDAKEIVREAESFRWPR